MDVTKIDDSIIKLNVGGSTYFTYIKTLEASKYFRSLLEGGMQNLTYINKEEIFIDRCGGLFEYILHFYQLAITQFLSIVKMQDLKSEAEYYQLEELVNKIDSFIKSPRKKQAEYRLMDMQELKSVTVKKSQSGNEGAAIKKSTEKYQVITALDVKYYFDICWQHDVYNSLESYSHPASSRRNKSWHKSMILVRRGI